MQTEDQKGLLALALIVGSMTMGGARQAKPTLESLAWIAGSWAVIAGSVEIPNANIS